MQIIDKKELLVVKSFYSQFIPPIIHKYRNNILFTNIDYNTMNLFIDYYNIKKYYNFFDYLSNISHYKILYYYYDEILINKYTTVKLDISNKKYRYVDVIHPVRWDEFIKNKYGYYFYEKNVPSFNVIKNELY